MLSYFLWQVYQQGLLNFGCLYHVLDLGLVQVHGLGFGPWVFLNSEEWRDQMEGMDDDKW